MSFMSGGSNPMLPKKHLRGREKTVFSIRPILLNLIVIAVLLAGYYFMVKTNLFYGYQGYIYWAINILVSYNILVASTRSFIMPIISVALGLALLFTSSIYDITLVTAGQAWQAIVLGIIGFIITVITCL